MKKKPILWYGSAITEKLLIKKCYRAGGAEIIWDLKKKAEIFTTVSLEGARIKKKTTFYLHRDSFNCYSSVLSGNFMAGDGAKKRTKCGAAYWAEQKKFRLHNTEYNPLNFSGVDLH